MTGHIPPVTCGHFLSVLAAPCNLSTSPRDRNHVDTESRTITTPLPCGRDSDKRKEEANPPSTSTSPPQWPSERASGEANLRIRCPPHRGRSEKRGGCQADPDDDGDGDVDGNREIEPQLVRIYLKQGFVTDGLLGVLNSPGTVVLLRDVGCQQIRG